MAPRTIEVPPATEYAKVDRQVCTICGIRQSGQHPDISHCIRALREYVAVLELLIERLHEELERVRIHPPCSKAPPEDDGQRGIESEHSTCFVILDGRRMRLADAARKLCLSAKALRNRVERRLGAVVDTVDLREIDIGTPARRGRPRAGTRKLRIVRNEQGHKNRLV